ncbi:transketolase [Streptomyces sp. NPDC004111]|uniref:transketolase n=1 Tax=Streptomyces sp. NPDC004111 TaxID=3364690 RepID=UPI0036A023F1
MSTTSGVLHAPQVPDPNAPRVFEPIDRRAVAVARGLALDAVERAGSGHPGTPLALTPVAHLLFHRHLRHDPADPAWEGRDRFVLSCGHASALLYTQLHLTGYDLSLDDLRRFRSLGSLTPGHPEYRHTPGVEMTTGPLGQGVATAVGMAMALKRDEHRRYPNGFPADNAAGTVVPRRTVYVLCSDGDLQEGISYEAGALAGRHELDNLVVVWDDNRIQIDGDTSLTSKEDTAARFVAQGWSVRAVPLGADGDLDTTLLDAELHAARAERTRPTLIVCRSQIAWPAPHAVNTPASHGAPLGAEEVAHVKRALGLDPEESFAVAPEVLAHTRSALGRGLELRREWDRAVAALESADPAAAAERARALRPFTAEEAANWLPDFETGALVAPRDASGRTIQALAARLPQLWGGSADLGDSNRTTIVGGGSFLPEGTGSGGRAGRNIHWGVREHAMAAAMNGMALVGYDRPFAGTFLVFSDYQRPSIRLAALMGLPVVYVWSHDSVALGADGPTHQPVEHLAALRAMPGMAVVRPADARETAAAWAVALETRGPVGLALARQGLPVLPTAAEDVRTGVARGAYVVTDSEGAPDVVLLASGSEVAPALAACAELAGEGLAARVVSVPCKEWFVAQDADYRDAVLPPATRARVVVEAASAFGWHDLIGEAGRTVTFDTFGTSAPADEAMRHMGITVEAVVSAARESLALARR